MSSASLRHFFVSDDNEMFRIPNTKFERLLKGSLEKKTKRFAGKRVRAAEIVVKLVMKGSSLRLALFDGQNGDGDEIMRFYFCIKRVTYAGSRDSMLLERCTMSCLLAVRQMGYQGAEVARFLGVTTSAVVRVADFEDLLKSRTIYKLI